MFLKCIYEISLYPYLINLIIKRIYALFCILFIKNTHLVYWKQSDTKRYKFDCVLFILQYRDCCNGPIVKENERKHIHEQWIS
jgi:hypothetical protein